ncbi:MAG TPA: aspartate aminotransferase family protein, partial [Aestuariivirgaceae bacterium]|nr:aspartate aminotransferase family protein [Aestuariivirgaceae bacterium]
MNVNPSLKGTTEKLLERRSKAIARGIGMAAPIFAKTAENSEIWDVEGRRFIDFAGGIAVLNTGHRHPAVMRRVQEQIDSFTHTCFMVMPYLPFVELAEKLNELAPISGDKKSIFVTTGAEAIENAVKIARAHTGRSDIICFQGGFHGRTVAAATMTTSGTRFSAGFSPLMGGVHMAPFPYAYHYGWDERTATDFCLRELDYLFATVTSPGETAAFFVEPVLGEGGYVPANSAFLRGLRERADEHGIVLVFDEIQTGFGRTGKFWGHDHFGVKPDVVTIAKGLASGFPLSGIAASKDLMAKAFPGSQGGTYGANAVSCAAALATL